MEWSITVSMTTYRTNNEQTQKNQQLLANVSFFKGNLFYINQLRS